MKHLALFAMAGGLLLAACTTTPAEPEGDVVPAVESTAVAPAADVPVEPTADPAAAPTLDAAAPAVAKVSANNATEEELIAAFEAAGIANAAKWTDEVMEYRPYAADDLEFTTLREELAKYNPEAGVIDQIIAVLEP